MYPQLEFYIKSISENTSTIPLDRKKKLGEIAAYIRRADKPQLVFICTHNSRRSHLCQVWADTAAYHFGLNQIETYSGGTEATAFNPRAVEALRRAGFVIEEPKEEGANPRYRVRCSDNTGPLTCYSKAFDDPDNPQKAFAAVMTCADADANCPVVPGASRRFSVPYMDPGEADGTPRETDVYDERCRQIATEMVFMISQV